MDYASHSPQVELIRDEILAVLAPISPVGVGQFRRSIRPSTGLLIDTDDLWMPPTGIKNLRSPGHFRAGHPSADGRWQNRFRRVQPASGADDRRTGDSGRGSHGRHPAPQTTVAGTGYWPRWPEAWCASVDVDFTGFLPGGRRVDLPHLRLPARALLAGNRTCRDAGRSGRGAVLGHDRPQRPGRTLRDPGSGGRRVAAVRCSPRCPPGNRAAWTRPWTRGVTGSPGSR